MLEVRKLAPPDEIVRYLAVFERCLRFIHNAGVRRNRSEMLLGGYLADALHNVLALLCSFDTDDWNQGNRFRAALRRAHEIVGNHQAPPDMIRACYALLEPVAPPEELGRRRSGRAE